MSEKWVTAGVTVIVAIIGVAALAVLVSRAAQTGTVIGAGSSGFAQLLCTATSPITGAACGTRSLIEDVNSTITFGRPTGRPM